MAKKTSSTDKNSNKNSDAAKKKMFRTRLSSGSYKKLVALILVFALALIIVCVRIVYLNIEKGDEYSIKVLEQQAQESTTIPYKRGSILDRNGNVLATSVMVYNVIVDCKLIIEDGDALDATAWALAKYFDEDEDEIKEEIQDRSSSHYWIFKKDLSYSEIEEFQAYAAGDLAETDAQAEEADKVTGVWFETDYERKYPYGSLASSVIGFTNAENEATVGIEASYADVLNGTNGRSYGYVDSDSELVDVTKDAVNGYNVVSTIDMNIQRIVEKAIKKYMKKYSPQMIAVVIMDPNTGEILAMADDGTFDCNDPYDLTAYYSDSEIDAMSESDVSDALNEIWRNYCVSDSYEPGSTVKPFTVAAALEEGVIDEDDTFYCDGSQVVGGYTIHCHETSGHGTISLTEAIAESCNDSLMQIAAKLGAESFAKYQANFGFGTKTGIDLPSETRGLTYEAEDMGASTLATNAFGQNFTVNMIQMTAAFSSLINGGYYYEPHVVKQITTEDGELVENYTGEVVKKTVTKDTSTFIKQCLRSVVTDGTGSTAAMDGYTVGGKTGTAEKVDEDGSGHVSGEYILSFLGCVPCEDPEIVCYTLMDSPEDNTQATAYNTELWRYIMKQVLPYLGIDQTETDETKAKKSDQIEEFYSNDIVEGDE